MEQITNIVAQISNIENRAIALMKDGEEEKQQRLKRHEDRIKAFDHDMMQKTEAELNSIQNELKSHMKEELDSERETTSQILNQMQQEFDKQHTIIAQKIVKSIIGA